MAAQKCLAVGVGTLLSGEYRLLAGLGNPGQVLVPERHLMGQVSMRERVTHQEELPAAEPQLPQCGVASLTLRADGRREQVNDELLIRFGQLSQRSMPSESSVATGCIDWSESISTFARSKIL